DLNVPMKDGAVTDATRIIRLVPTLKELSAAGAKVVLLSHFGRPRGKEPALTLRPIVKALEKACGFDVAFAADCVGTVAEDAIKTPPADEVLMLENVRL